MNTKNTFIATFLLISAMAVSLAAPLAAQEQETTRKKKKKAGKKMRKKGDKGAPTDKAFRDSKKTARKK